ncbi:hypothetical protein [Mesomycoplasma hyopneumoniae]|nr:hypothetical protein [Mesomycoplasma hyopneumoniae]
MSLENPLELKQEQNYEGIRERLKDLFSKFAENSLKFGNYLT